jgi:hypothetical protein
MAGRTAGPSGGATATGSRRARLTRNERIGVAGLAVAVVSALVAIATFIYPGGFVGGPEGSGTVLTPTGQGTPEVDRGGPTTPTGGTATGPPTTSTAGSRALAEITPTSGGDTLAPVAGEPRSREMACPTNQGGDKDRTVQWDLVGPWSRVRMTLTVSGRADPDTRSQIEVFSGGTRVFNDAQLRVGAEAVPVDADISGSRTLIIRLTCASRALAVRLHGPELRR